MCQSYNSDLDISIHALLAESDGDQFLGGRDHDISIHALLAESDYTIIESVDGSRVFLSTLSLRRATCSSGRVWYDFLISIHALLAESDDLKSPVDVMIPAFLSTLSLRRATSIKPLCCHLVINFYPRSPCGERLEYSIRFSTTLEFLSTLSLRRATKHGTKMCELFVFLSTLSLRRATAARYTWRLGAEYFYPRSPCGERLLDSLNGFVMSNISIHALLAESD